jgi:hypothetical protein
VENRPVNQPVKAAVPRANVAEPQQTEKKVSKTSTTKSTTQKTTNPNKPIVNAPVKPMPNKRTLSPADDRLSDEECNTYLFIYLNKHFVFPSKASPDSPAIGPIFPSNPAPVQTQVTARRASHTTLG